MEDLEVGSEAQLDPTSAFARAVALKEIEECTNLKELKAVAINLAKLYFAQKHIIGQMIIRSSKAGVDSLIA